MAVGPDLSRLSLTQLAELTGRDRRWLKRRLAEAGVSAVAETGRSRLYPAQDALEGIYGRQRDEEAEARVRERAARAEMAELELAERRGELIPREEVVSTWSEHIARARALLRALPKAMVRTVPGFTRGTAVEALRMVDEALNELATDGLPRKRGRLRGELGGGGEAA